MICLCLIQFYFSVLNYVLCIYFHGFWSNTDKVNVSKAKTASHTPNLHSTPTQDNKSLPKMLRETESIEAHAKGAAHSSSTCKTASMNLF